jgi:hypothetical protein
MGAYNMNIWRDLTEGEDALPGDRYLGKEGAWLRIRDDNHVFKTQCGSTNIIIQRIVGSVSGKSANRQTTVELKRVESMLGEADSILNDIYKSGLLDPETSARILNLYKI